MHIPEKNLLAAGNARVSLAFSFSSSKNCCSRQDCEIKRAGPAAISLSRMVEIKKLARRLVASLDLFAHGAIDRVLGRPFSVISKR